MESSCEWRERRENHRRGLAWTRYEQGGTPTGNYVGGGDPHRRPRDLRREYAEHECDRCRARSNSMLKPRLKRKNQTRAKLTPKGGNADPDASLSSQIFLDSTEESFNPEHHSTAIKIEPDSPVSYHTPSYNDVDDDCPDTSLSPLSITDPLEEGIDSEDFCTQMESELDSQSFYTPYGQDYQDMGQSPQRCMDPSGDSFNPEHHSTAIKVEPDSPVSYHTPSYNDVESVFRSRTPSPQSYTNPLEEGAHSEDSCTQTPTEDESFYTQYGDASYPDVFHTPQRYMDSTGDCFNPEHFSTPIKTEPDSPVSYHTPSYRDEEPLCANDYPEECFNPDHYYDEQAECPDEYSSPRFMDSLDECSSYEYSSPRFMDSLDECSSYDDETVYSDENLYPRRFNNMDSLDESFNPEYCSTPIKIEPDSPVSYHTPSYSEYY